MMAHRRGTTVALAGLFLLIIFNTADSASFIVGDDNGWGFDAEDWPKGKSFKAGDVLVFEYNPMVHNVVAVSASEYQSCAAFSDSKVFESGDDHITLTKGDNYFLCSFPGHCDGGMKIAVSAA